MKIGVEAYVFSIIAIFLAVMSLIFVVPNMQTNQTESSLPNLGPAPEVTGIKAWINSQPLKIQELRGKVVLVDFWTYSCINCIRTLPYLKKWDEKYRDKGLVIIGMHTPEFEFEKDYSNVKQAVERYGIKYAVAQDNDYATWRAYKNSYWPRKYLIDKDGSIRYDHIGEGAYEETERAILALLNEAGADVSDMTISDKADRVNFTEIGTPELYLGYNFARAPLGNPEGFSPGNVVDYKQTNITQPNIVYLSGKWKNEADRIIAVNDSLLFLVYRAKNVNIVGGGAAVVNVLLDGKYLDEKTKGQDTLLTNGKSITIIDSQRLYNIVSAPDYRTHLLGISANPGFEIYAFTFG